jgi:hypothetical protein
MTEDAYERIVAVEARLARLETLAVAMAWKVAEPARDKDIWDALRAAGLARGEVAG